MIFVHFCETHVMRCSCCCRHLKTGNGSPSPSGFQSVVFSEHFLLEAKEKNKKKKKKKKKKKAMTMCLQGNAAFRKKMEDNTLSGAFGFNFQ